jgi:hypothetical protein
MKRRTRNRKGSRSGTRIHLALTRAALSTAARVESKFLSVPISLGLETEVVPDQNPVARAASAFSLQFLLLASAALSLALPANAQSVADLLSGRFSARGIVTAFYEGTEQPPSLVVRIESVYTDYERKGFFRIGLLPVGVMEGVALELNHAEYATNSLAHLHQWLGPHSGKTLELRRLTLLVPAGVTNRLESARARVGAGGKLDLFDGVSLVSGTNHLRAARGTLQVTGARAGEVVLETIPPCTNSLLPHPAKRVTKRGPYRGQDKVSPLHASFGGDARQVSVGVRSQLLAGAKPQSQLRVKCRSTATERTSGHSSAVRSR